MKIELMCTEMVITDLIDGGAKQKDLHVPYAMAMCSSYPTDWKELNTAIIERWSMAGLISIKKAAHKLIKEKQNA